MREVLRFALFVGLICLALMTQGQTSDKYVLTIHRETNALQIVNDLSDEYGISFSYPTSALERVMLSPKTVKDSQLKSFLSRLFDQTGITFLLKEDQILLQVRENYQAPPSFIQISGVVTDEGNDLPLSQVAVYLPEKKIGTLTNEAGVFTLTIPASDIKEDVIIRSLGYQTVSRSVKRLKADPQIALKGKPLSIKPISIEEHVPPFIPSNQIKMTERGIQQALRPGLFGNDILRNIQRLPGIFSADDASAEISIRGSEGSETLIVLDGIPLYHASHFYGIFSGINSDYINEIELHKNTLPIEYGGKTGGMVLLRSEEDVSGFTGKLDMNTLTSSLQLGFPLGNKAALVLGGRTTYQNAAQSALFQQFGGNNTSLNITDFQEDSRKRLINNEPIYQFNDINAKLILKPSDQTELSFNYFRSQDDFENSYNLEYRTRLRNSPERNVEIFENLEGWTNEGAAINLSLKLNSDWSINSRIFFTSYENDSRIFSSLSQTSFFQQKLDIYTNERKNSIVDVGGNVSFSYQSGQDDLLEFGSGITQHDNLYFFKTESDTTLKGGLLANEYHGFARYVIREGYKWELSLGNRITYYEPAGRWYWVPRITGKYNLNDFVSIKAALSQNYQFVRQSIHENRLGQSIAFWLLADEVDFPIGKSTTFMLGTTFRKGPWTLDVEAYLKDMDNVIENAQLIPGFKKDRLAPVAQTPFQTFVGTGQSIGVDLLLNLDLDMYQGFLSYTLSRTTNEFPEIANNTTYASPNDRRHQLSFVNQFSWKEFRLDLGHTFASGRPYSDFSLLTDRQERIFINPNDRIRRIPDYHRTDLGISYGIPIKGINARFGANVYNLLNRTNIKYLQYTYSIPASDQSSQGAVIGSETTLLSRTLNLSLRLEW
ncbi:MAG: carboxypeptidase-like regulatory domain-containing protein [Bacteroidota bacterium]